jgi:hypothetical protein
MLYSLGTIKAVNRNDRFTSIRDVESVAANCVTRLSLAEPLSISARVWYHNTALVTREA